MNKRGLAFVLRLSLSVLALAAAACGQNPETTEKARGILEGPNIVLALSVVFLVAAGGLIAGVVGLDRFVRSRRALETAPPPEAVEEEEEEVVAGIGVGRASVPRWLYGFYVLIPAFAFLYVVNNVALRPAAEEQAEETEAPTGPQEEWTIVASAITFDLDTMIVPAETEVTVTFDNQDTGVIHDFTVWENEATATANDTGAQVAKTDQITGGNEDEVSFTSPGAGELFFNCTVHPTTMTGTVEVVEG
jgi:plastocyanin